MGRQDHHIAVLEPVDNPKHAATHFRDGLIVLLCHRLVSVFSWGLEATGASWKGSEEADGEASPECGDGVRHVPFRPDRRHRAGGNLGEAQVA